MLAQAAVVSRRLLLGIGVYLLPLRHPVPVAKQVANERPGRLYRILIEDGDAELPFAPFAGFTPFPFYSNYSEPFFDGQHYVLKGASPRTAACFLRPSFRNWFRPSYPYVYGTFRMVKS